MAAQDGLLRQVAPLTGPSVGESILTLIEDYEALARSLGADLEKPDLAADKQAFETALEGFKAAVAADPRLKLDVETTRAYYRKQGGGLNTLISILGTVIGAIMAIGAVFGALNTMFATVAARAREIATLRAIGFRGLPVVVAVMLETMLLALLGGLLGGLLAWSIFNGYSVSTLGSNFSQVVFQFKVSPELLWSGLKWALGIGLVGGLFPALRAARLPIAGFGRTCGQDAWRA